MMNQHMTKQKLYKSAISKYASVILVTRLCDSFYSVAV